MLRKARFVLSILVLSAGVVGLDAELSAQTMRSNAVDAVVEIYLGQVNGQDKCMADPDTLYLSQRKKKGLAHVIAFLASTPDVVVSDLDSYPAERGKDGKDVIENPNSPRGKLNKPDRQANRLSSTPSVSVDSGRFRVVTLNEGAFGTYQYNIQCGQVGDDPPALIVDR